MVFEDFPHWGTLPTTATRTTTVTIMSEQVGLINFNKIEIEHLKTKESLGGLELKFWLLVAALCLTAVIVGVYKIVQIRERRRHRRQMERQQPL